MLAVNIAGFDSLAFVVALFAFTEGNDNFDVAAAGEQFGRHDGHALLFIGGKRRELLLTHEEFTGLGIDGAGAWFATFVQF